PARASSARSRPTPCRAPSARSLAFDVLRDREKRKAEEQARADALRGIDEGFREVLALADELIALIRKGQATPLAEWRAKAEAPASAQTRGLRAGDTAGRGGGVGGG